MKKLLKSMSNAGVQLIFLSLLFLVAGCKKETRYIYQVQEQELYQSGNQKRTVKTTTQFISIAYNDLFGTGITTGELNKLDVALQSFGDKAVLQDILIRSLINRSGVQIVDNNTMRSDINGFVEAAYLRVFNRRPTEYESWKMTDLISKNQEVTPKMVYYSLMTSEEYRYY